MTEGAVVSDVSPVVDQITGIRAAVGDLNPATTEAEAIERIRELEHLKAACAATQAQATATLEQLRLADEADRDVPKARRGRGPGAEVGVTRGEAATHG